MHATLPSEKAASMNATQDQTGYYQLPNALLGDTYSPYLNAALSRRVHNRMNEKYVPEGDSGSRLAFLAISSIVASVFSFFIGHAMSNNQHVDPVVPILVMSFGAVAGLAFISLWIAFRRISGREDRRYSAWSADRREFIRMEVEVENLIPAFNGAERELLKQIEDTRAKIVTHLIHLDRTKGSSDDGFADGWSELFRAVESMANWATAPKPNPDHIGFLGYNGKDRNIKLLAQKFMDDEARRESLLQKAKAALSDLQNKELSLRAEIAVKESGAS